MLCFLLLMRLYLSDSFAQAGIFKTKDDYINNRVEKIDTNDLILGNIFGEDFLTVKIKGVKVKYKVEDIYGFRDYDGFMYRKYNTGYHEYFVKMHIRGAICFYGNNISDLRRADKSTDLFACYGSDFSKSSSYIVSKGLTGELIWLKKKKDNKAFISFDQDALNYYDKNGIIGAIVYYNSKHPTENEYIKYFYYDKFKLIKVGY